MGQYFHVLMISEDGTEMMANPHHFDNGVKLMEHSWIGNDFVNAVLHELEDKPTRIAWIGDYSDSAVEEKCTLGGGYITGYDAFLRMFQTVWSDECSIQSIPPDTPQFKLDIEHADCFIVNRTKKCYIDMEKYVKENVGDVPYDNRSWCVHPLPLLTALGNGMGGGDYRGTACINDVGSWAFDEIYVTYLRPGNFEAVEFCFEE